MPSNFLLYGANGFVGREIARLAVKKGLRPILAGRDRASVESIAAELGLEHRVFDLDHVAIDDVAAVLHCAGPYVHTYKPMVDACLAHGVHYLDITGEIPVYEAIAARGDEAKSRRVMLLPGVGFDVVPTDCLAVHLQRRLPSATHLTLAFQAVGRAGLPPGTQRTVIEMIPFGDRVRRDGKLVAPDERVSTREVDFGRGPVLATRLTWGDVFTAYYSTGIPNIEDYAVVPPSMRKQMALVSRLRFLFKLSPVRKLLKRGVKPGSTPEERTQTTTHVWGEVVDGRGGRATARLHGPEAGVVWTSEAALAAVRRVLGGDVRPGFQTAGAAYGPDFVLETPGVTREDVAT
jgi:short subunit dehydrogenase-like uncharacterized protein